MKNRKNSDELYGMVLAEQVETQISKSDLTKELILAVQSKNINPTILTQNIAQLKNRYPNDKTFTLCLAKQLKTTERK